MKKTTFVRQIEKDNRKYKLKKLFAYVQMILSFGNRRTQRASAYSIYRGDYHFHRNNNALPTKYYFRPTDIIIYDLIRKEDLSKVERGLIKLFRKCYSHKFIGGARSEEDIDGIIEGLNQTLHSKDSWYRTSIFDFAYDEVLESYISCFEISFHNFTSSFVAVEMKITLSEGFVSEISQFISEPYEKPGMCVHRIWARNKKRSGAIMIDGISSGTSSEYAKSQIVYEQLQYVKQIFLREIIKVFPLMLYAKFANLGSINIFETNITPSIELDRSVYSGLGLDDMYGFYFSLSERLYTSTRTMMSRDTDRNDMMFVYNPELITDYQMYWSAHNKVLEQLTRGYLNDLYRIVVLSGIGKLYRDLISEYRNKINKCKNTRRQHKTLLKLQYHLNRDFYDFRKIDEELPVDQELENARESLEKNGYARSSIHYWIHTCEQFTSVPKWIWEQIRSNYAEVTKDLNRKLDISDSLAKYTSEKKNRILIFIQVVLAAATFYLLLFPHRAQNLATILVRIWELLSSVH